MELSLVPETIPPRSQVNSKLGLLAVLNKFLQPIHVSAEEFSPQWKSLSGPPLKLQEVVRGVRPLPLLEMDPNPNNLVASTTFHSESTSAMLCLMRIETDPANRTQLPMTVASGYPALTFELKEFIKEQLVSIHTGMHIPMQEPPMAQQASTPEALTDPGAMLAALI